jgi:hypothetical protein
MPFSLTECGARRSPGPLHIRVENARVSLNFRVVRCRPLEIVIQYACEDTVPLTNPPQVSATVLGEIFTSCLGCFPKPFLCAEYNLLVRHSVRRYEHPLASQVSGRDASAASADQLEREMDAGRGAIRCPVVRLIRPK